MYEVWNKRRQEKEQAKECINAQIASNYEDIQEYVIEYLDEARDAKSLMKELAELRAKRNRLFAVRDDLEEEIGWLEQALSEAHDRPELLNQANNQ